MPYKDPIKERKYKKLYARAYRKIHPEKVKEMNKKRKKYKTVWMRNKYQTNQLFRKKQLEYQKWKWHNDPQYKAYKIQARQLWAEKNREHIREYMRKRNQATKKAVFDFYGKECKCCRENRQEFLTVDHIKGGGTKHRKTIMKNFYRWLVINNFPKDFRILCMNCNWSLGHWNYCPHRKKVDDPENFLDIIHQKAMGQHLPE